MTTKTGGPPLSVTIVAQNEERTIAAVLAAVTDIADEIVFLDSGSTDRTVEIAKSFGVRFYHQDWLGYAEQKNKAIDLASGEWILSLDADEVLTPGAGGGNSRPDAARRARRYRRLQNTSRPLHRRLAGPRAADFIPTRSCG